MKVRTQAGAILSTLLLGATVCLSGCATTGGEKAAAKTTTKIQTAENDMKQSVVQVDATNAALQTLIAPDQTGLQKAYDNYKTNVSKMDKVSNQVNKHDDQMRAQGKEYFSEWEKRGTSYTDPQLRAASDERRAELSNIYNKIPESTVGMKEAMNTYLSELKQIQSYLATDLTPKGVEAMTPAAQKAIQDGEKLKDAIRPVITAMDRARTELYPPGAGGAAAGGTR